MKYLILGGGSLALFATLGHVKKLHDQGRLDDLQEISGASAGSMIAVAWALFKEDALEKLMHVDTTKFFKMNIKSFIRDGGLSTMDGCRSEFHRIMGDQVDMTFSDLYTKTGLKVHIAAFSLDKNSTDYFSVLTTPSMKLIDALCKSCCVPILFTPQDGHVDGGLAEQLPFSPFIQYTPQDIYAVRINFSPKKQSYFRQLATILMLRRNDCPIDCVCRDIDIGDVNVFDFKMPVSTKHSLFLIGYHA